MMSGQIYSPTASASRKHHNRLCGTLLQPERISVFVRPLITQHACRIKKETSYCIGTLALLRHTTKQNAYI